MRKEALDLYPNRGIMKLTAHPALERVGQMAAVNLRTLYSRIATQRLRELRSIKYNRLERISGCYSWGCNREKEALRNQIKSIDVELACRAAQMTLL